MFPGFCSLLRTLQLICCRQTGSYYLLMLKVTRKEEVDSETVTHSSNVCADSPIEWGMSDSSLSLFFTLRNWSQNQIATHCSQHLIQECISVSWGLRTTFSFLCTFFSCYILSSMKNYSWMSDSSQLFWGLTALRNPVHISIHGQQHWLHYYLTCMPFSLCGSPYNKYLEKKVDCED